MSTFKEKLGTMYAEVITEHKKNIEKSEKDKNSFYGFKPSKRGIVPFLSPRELSQHLGISLKTLERMRKDGSGPPFVKIRNKQIRYPIASLDTWIAKNETVQ